MATERRGATSASVNAVADVADYPLYVVTVAAFGGEVSGCLAGFVTQCSISPVRYLVCISPRNHTYGYARRARALALHALGAGQADTARLFGEETGDEVDKLARCAWHPGPDGVPVLDRCAAWVAGPTLGTVPVGDHQAFLVEPVDGGAGPEAGLLTIRNGPDLKAGHPA